MYGLPVVPPPALFAEQAWLDAVPFADVEKPVFRPFYIKIKFDIPKGAIRVSESKSLMDHTVWTSVTDNKMQAFITSRFKPKQLNVSICVKLL